MLSPRLQRALAKLNELAVDGVVSGKSFEIAFALGFSARSLFDVLASLEELGLALRCNRRGQRTLVVKITTCEATSEAKTSTSEATCEVVKQPVKLVGEGGEAGTTPLGVKVSKAAAAAAAASESSTYEATCEVVKLVAVVRDLAATVRTQAEEIALQAEELAQLRSRVSHDNEPTALGVEHRDVKPENVQDLLEITPDERAAIAERFAQARDNNEHFKSPTRISQLVVEDCRTKPGVLQGYKDSAARRRERAEEARVAREKLEAERAQAQRERAESIARYPSEVGRLTAAGERFARAVSP